MARKWNQVSKTPDIKQKGGGKCGAGAGGGRRAGCGAQKDGQSGRRFIQLSGGRPGGRV